MNSVIGVYFMCSDLWFQIWYENHNVIERYIFKYHFKIETITTLNSTLFSENFVQNNLHNIQVKQDNVQMPYSKKVYCCISCMGSKIIIEKSEA